MIRLYYIVFVYNHALKIDVHVLDLALAAKLDQKGQHQHKVQYQQRVDTESHHTYQHRSTVILILCTSCDVVCRSIYLQAEHVVLLLPAVVIPAAIAILLLLVLIGLRALVVLVAFVSGIAKDTASDHASGHFLL